MGAHQGSWSVPEDQPPGLPWAAVRGSEGGEMFSLRGRVGRGGWGHEMCSLKASLAELGNLFAS